MAHNWCIPEREYIRHEQRRGRRYAFERIDPATTALVVVDMIPFFARENVHCRDVIDPINRLAAALRRQSGCIAWVLPSELDPHPELSDEFFGIDVAEMYRNSGGKGQLSSRLCPGLTWREEDLFVEKRSLSAFFPGYCNLSDELTELGIRTVIVAGTVTNVCCESTARDARQLGYRVIMAADANAAVTDCAHNATLRTIYRSFGDVRSTADLLRMISGEDSPQDL